ncbi:MAG TPA: sigma-70 family RNA polymerase sigma factor [Pseudonocardiaceae bacterium]|nr:sigma-70 family RNA polymerase sigma factor [Pseudonocardiaceae bacterium]
MPQVSAAARPVAMRTSRTRPSAPANSPDGPPDVDLLARLNAGDPHAMRLLYERYARLAHALAQRTCRDQSLAEDVVQEVFLTLWRGSSRYTRARGTVPAWLFTLVHHKAVDAVRREHTAHRRTVPINTDGEFPPQPGADEAALASVLADQLRTALHRLPHPQRQPLLLAYYGGYTHREISELAQIPLGTVKSRISLGIQRLRTLLHPLLDTTATT